MVIQKPREIAAHVLLQHGEGHAFLEEILERELAGKKLSGEDRGLVQELCYGVLRWRATLDWLIERRQHHRRPDFQGQTLLRLGLYQLFWLDRIPPHAAVNETVELVRSLNLGAQSGFVNAMLRTYAREAEATRKELLELRTKDPALGWSHPRWLVDRWRKHLTPDELQAFLAWNNTPAPVYVRINRLKCDPGPLIEQWRQDNVDYDFQRWDWVENNLVFLLRRHPPIERLKSYRNGSFYVQDPSTLMPVHVLDPQPGESILDLCAAPGGKTTYIAQRVDNDGRIVAVDPNPKRRTRLKENCERLAADVTVVEPSAPEAEGPFDAILVDAPCSNTGVLRRRLDARWRLSPERIQAACERQLELLKLALQRLRPGGRLVYSTCSVEPEENGEMIRKLLEFRPGLKLETERSLHPARDGVDGAYAALLRNG